VNALRLSNEEQADVLAVALSEYRESAELRCPDGTGDARVPEFAAQRIHLRLGLDPGYLDAHGGKIESRVDSIGRRAVPRRERPGARLRVAQLRVDGENRHD